MNVIRKENCLLALSEFFRYNNSCIFCSLPIPATFKINFFFDFSQTYYYTSIYLFYSLQEGVINNFFQVGIHDIFNIDLSPALLEVIHSSSHCKYNGESDEDR